ncbi:hypothetical protein P1X14_20335 [Sphingomonas sp. AOB5]|uniref:DUF6891 domain-containing protein n=1 Tax=Sphingomonas sp. AOB5 TaxID=3034017 RepID=UPI0023FA0228|nr:hypothetical protein [Sphingomonas sp. AOB5]MDF7777616.1 hypothetical protein [Sphingomonas sp. AOB5]
MKGFLARLFGLGKGAAPSPPPAAQAPAEDPVAILRDHIRREVAMGFRDEDVILTEAPDLLGDDLDPAWIQREAPRLLREALADHADVAAGWPATTDCDRLDAAFAALEADGVIARQNFTCCSNCGSTEIWDEIALAQDAGLPAHGYTFYHIQDTESAAEGHGVYLGYGACEEGEDAALDVAREILVQLEAHGLAPEWDGSWDRKIHVPLDWKKRRGVARA